MSIRSGIITLTTDFGGGSFAGVMKGVILGIFPGARIVDLDHQLRRGDVAGAAWSLRDAAPFFPKGTVHLGVVDPGVGSSRRGLALACAGSFFVGPDNGIFSAFYPAEQVVELNRPEMFLTDVSRTFHGRDVFAPVAARLASGLALEALGDPVADPVSIELAKPKKKGGAVIGEVVSIDPFGNLITNLPEPMVPRDKNITVRVCRAEISGVSPCYNAARPGALIALIGSHGRLEIAASGGSAAEVLEAQVGDEVEIIKSG